MLSRVLTRTPAWLLQSKSLHAAHSTSSPSFVETCPSPTCECSDTPAMPEGFEIDYSKPLNGTMATFAEQVLVCTGTTKWKSKIEEDNDGDNLVADIKELTGRGGMYSDPYHNISILNCSLPSSIPSRREIQTVSAYLFPSFKYIPFLPRVSFDSVRALVKGYLLPTQLNVAHQNLSPIHRDRLTRSQEYQSALHGVQDVEDIIVLICGHHARDPRCGILGPLLQAEFERCLERIGHEVAREAVHFEEGGSPPQIMSSGVKPVARVGQVSHVGGHKFAGNVMIYIPPALKREDGTLNALAGSAVMYGRVEPKHVEGILKEILDGKLIKDIFRGGVRQNDGPLRL